MIRDKEREESLCDVCEECPYLFDGEGGEVGGLVVLPALEVDGREQQQDPRVRRVLGGYLFI